MLTSRKQCSGCWIDIYQQVRTFESLWEMLWTAQHRNMIWCYLSDLVCRKVPRCCWMAGIYSPDHINSLPGRSISTVVQYMGCFDLVFFFVMQIDYNDRPNAELIMKSKKNADLIIKSVDYTRWAHFLEDGNKEKEENIERSHEYSPFMLWREYHQFWFKFLANKLKLCR